MESKICSMCGVEKLYSDYYNCPSKGVISKCKPCYSAYARENRKKYKQTITNTNKAWRSKNKDKVAIHNKNYYQKKPGIIYEANRRWVENNKDKRKQHIIKYKSQNPEKLKTYRVVRNIELDDRYMFSKLKREGYPIDILNKCPELIDTRRILIKTKRLLKNGTST